MTSSFASPEQTALMLEMVDGATVWYSHDGTHSLRLAAKWARVNSQVVRQCLSNDWIAPMPNNRRRYTITPKGYLAFAGAVSPSGQS